MRRQRRKKTRTCVHKRENTTKQPGIAQATLLRVALPPKRQQKCTLHKKKKKIYIYICEKFSSSFAYFFALFFFLSPPNNNNPTRYAYVFAFANELGSSMHEKICYISRLPVWPIYTMILCFLFYLYVIFICVAFPPPPSYNVKSLSPPSIARSHRVARRAPSCIL